MMLTIIPSEGIKWHTKVTLCHIFDSRLKLETYNFTNKELQYIGKKELMFFEI